MIQWQFHWPWIVSPWAMGFGLLALLAWVVIVYVREAKKLVDQNVHWQARLGYVAGLIVIRLLVLGLLVVLWSEPTVERTRMGKPSLVLLVDRSVSMNHTDPATSMSAPKSSKPSRFTRMVQTMLAGKPSFLERLEESYHVELVAFAEEFHRLEPTGSQSLIELLHGLSPVDELPLEKGAADEKLPDKGPPAATRLGDAVDFALQRLPESGYSRAGLAGTGLAGTGLAGAGPAVIVLLSDGIGTRGKPLAAAAVRAREQGVPLYTVAVGSERPLTDVALGRPLAAETLFLGDALSVETTIRAVGLAGQSARVSLRDTATDQVLDQRTVELPPTGEDKPIRLQVRPEEVGLLSLELQIKLLPAAQQSAHLSHSYAEETNLENNRQPLVVQVHDEPIRVLLVQSGPSYEFRALKEMLQRDPALQLSVWLQEADRQFAAVDASALSHFPLAEQELFAYDVVVWGDVDPEPISRLFWPRLLRWVTERGGGLALLAGPRYFPRAFRANPEMTVLLPIRSSQGSGRVGTYAMEPTAEGLGDPVLQLGSTPAASQAVWSVLPPFTWLWETAQVKPGAQRLVEAVSIAATTRWPVVLRHFVGAGEVLMHLTDETWRLRYRTDDRVFARYWGQAVRRLARGKLLARSSGLRLNTDAREYRLGTPVHVRAQFYDPAQAPAEGPLVLQWESSAQSRRPLELQRRWDQRGLFEATLRELPAGEHQLHWLPALPQADRPAEHSGELSGDGPAKLSSPRYSATVRFKVHAPARELARLAVDRQTLSAAARETHGKTYTLQSVDRLPEELPPARPVPWEHLPPHRLASTHTVIGLLVGLLAAEWTLRRRKGLL